MATTTLTHQRETTHELIIPMPKAKPTTSPLPPMQLSQRTLAWLAERPHALHHVRSVWDALTESAERPDLVATLRAILIDHHFLTRTGRCHACRGTWRRGWTLRRRHFPCKVWYTVESGLQGFFTRSPVEPKPAFRGPMMSTRLSCERLMGAPGQSLIKNLLQEVWVSVIRG